VLSKGVMDLGNKVRILLKITQKGQLTTHQRKFVIF
jgi:hypothetical protein